MKTLKEKLKQLELKLEEADKIKIELAKLNHEILEETYELNRIMESSKKIRNEFRSKILDFNLIDSNLEKCSKLDNLIEVEFPEFNDSLLKTLKRRGVSTIKDLVSIHPKTLTKSYLPHAALLKIQNWYSKEGLKWF